MNKTNTKDMISVIIPTYNRQELVIRSVNSVLNQTYKNIEVIVVDDCSTDDTEKELKKIKDKRLKYVKLKTNSGACCARNTGIKEAKGKYIAFQDSDDVFHKDKLEKQLNNLLKNKSDLDFCKIGLDDSEIPTKNQDEILKKGKILDLLCEGNFISTQAILAKKEVFDNNLFDETLPRLQDYDLVLRIVPNHKISYTAEVLVDLYKQGDNITSSDGKMKKACVIMLRKKYPLSDSQEETLIKALMFYSVTKEINYLNDKYDKLAEEYKKIDTELQNIINSKRWKLINKILRK